MSRFLYLILGGTIHRIANLLSRLRNKYYLLKLAACGKGCHIEGNCNLPMLQLYLGNNVYIGPGATFVSSDAKIIVGDNVMFGPNVMIATGNHRIDVVGKLMVDVKCKRECDDQDVIIEDDCWIGMSAIILKGVTIGRGSVIGAGAIITKDVPPYSVVTGTRTNCVRQRFSDCDLSLHKELLYNQR